MQDRKGNAVTLAAPEATATGWRGRAVQEYERSLPTLRADLRTDLTDRLLVLTGQRIAPEDVYADLDGRLAVANVDGTTFRLYRGGDLVVVRSCAYCATGHFESPHVSGAADLGYALSAWQPLHEECEDYYVSEELAEL